MKDVWVASADERRTDDVVRPKRWSMTTLSVRTWAVASAESVVW